MKPMLNPQFSATHGTSLPGIPEDGRAGHYFSDRRLAAAAGVMQWTHFDDFARGRPEAHPCSTQPSGRSRRMGLGWKVSLRLGGMLLIAMGIAATYALFQRVPSPGHQAGAADYALALFAFASVSAGSVLLSLGTHIFDEVKVSRPWRVRR